MVILSSEAGKIEPGGIEKKISQVKKPVYQKTEAGVPLIFNCIIPV